VLIDRLLGDAEQDLSAGCNDHVIAKFITHSLDVFAISQLQETKR
jgi:hypothetical protein